MREGQGQMESGVCREGQVWEGQMESGVCRDHSKGPQSGTGTYRRGGGSLRYKAEKGCHKDMYKGAEFRVKFHYRGPAASSLEGKGTSGIREKSFAYFFTPDCPTLSTHLIAQPLPGLNPSGAVLSSAG